jgi:MFS transporter, DHA3 family, macrolide efflux protein
MKNSVRAFYWIIITQTLSIIGSQMTSFALGVKVYEDTGKATPLALVAFFSQLPIVLTTGFAGVLADRWDRKRMMILADVGQAFVTFLLLLAFLTDNFAVWQLYLAAVFQAIFGSFQMPAFTATVTMLVPDEKRDLANIIQQINRPAAGIIAPILAGLLVVLVGTTGVMTIDLLTFFVAMGAIISVNIPRPTETHEGRAAKGSMREEMWSGFQFLIERRTLLYLMIYATLLNFLFSMSYSVNTPYILAVTDSKTALGFILAAGSAGPFIGGIIFGAWKRNIARIHVIFIAIILMGLFLAFFGTARTPLLLGLMSFLAIFPNPAANASIMSMLQLKTPPDMQGRVFAAISQVAMLASPLAFLIAGPLVDQVLEPMVGTSAWDVVSPVVGHQLTGQSLY